MATKLKDANQIVKLVDECQLRMDHPLPRRQYIFVSRKLEEIRRIAANIHASKTTRETELPGNIGGAKRKGRVQKRAKAK